MIRKKGAIFFSMLLVAVLCVSLVPVTMAEENSPIVSPPTLTAGYAANIVVEVAGGSLDGTKVTARILVNGEAYASPVENGRAVIRVPLSARIGAGQYTIDILMDGEVKQTGSIEVLPAPDGLWKLGIYYNQELSTPVLDILFGESITPQGKNYSVTVNGKAVSCQPAGDLVIRIVEAMDDYIIPGEKHSFVISGVKYKNYFPNYSFTFAISYSI